LECGRRASEIFLDHATKLDELLHFIFCFLNSSYIAKCDFVFVPASMRAFDLPKLSAPFPAIRICWREKKVQHQQEKGRLAGNRLRFAQAHLIQF